MLTPRTLRRTSGLRYVLFLLFFFVNALCCAQKLLETTTISVADGLASPAVRHVMQDSYGLLWIATANGLQKYDGYRFQTFKPVSGNASSISQADTWSVLEDREHNLWISHANGVSKFDRQTNTFRNYNFNRIFNFEAGASALVFKLFLDSSGRLWAGTRNVELVLYDPAQDTWKYATYDIPGLDPRVPHAALTLGITEDSAGGIWAASTAYGLLYCPKGASAFKQVAPEKLKPIFVSSDVNSITDLHVDKDDVLWITTRTGVYKYFPASEEIKAIKEYNEASGELYTFLNRMVADPDGNIWIVNNFRGLLKFKGNTDEFEEISIAGKLKVTGYGWNITLTSLAVDRSGIFWVSSLEGGLLKYDPVNKPFSVLSHNPGDAASLGTNAVFGAAASNVKPGVVYIGTRGHGLNIYDPARRGFKSVKFKAKDDRYGGSVRGLAEDAAGNIWLGTWGEGMIKLDRDFNEVARYKSEPSAFSTISGNLVRVIRPWKDGLLWVGTDDGLNLFNSATGIFERILSKDMRPYPQVVTKTLNQLLAGDGKIAVIDRVGNMEDRIQPFEIREEGSYIVVVSGEADYRSPADLGWLMNAKGDTLWMFPAFDSTRSAGGAAKNRMIVKTVKLTPGSYVLRYRSDDSHAYNDWNEPPPDQVDLYGIALLKPANTEQLHLIENGIVPDEKEMLVVGSSISDIEVTNRYVWVSAANAGLSRIDPVLRTVENFVHSDDPASVSSNTIHDVFEDREGVIWLATDEGICRFDEATKTFTQYDEDDGLPTNLTTCIQEGDNGEMWIATQNGISQMVRNERIGKVTFINYNSTDGLGGDVFLQLASTRGSDGAFYFGGDHGVTTFRSVTANQTPPAVVFSNLFVSNRSVLEAGAQSFLNGSLLDASQITLPFDQNNLSFEFAALHYANPRKNQYAHMLKGYDQDWIYDNRTFASYTNLDPGEYDFMVRASNAYGIWNEEGKSIHITILPPWWRTWWAYVSYVLLFGVTIYIGDKAIRNNIKQRERERSRDKELKQAKEIEKAYAHLKETQAQLVQSEKMASLGELTAGIAHEIQNPLNFVNNFSEINRELIDEMNQELASGNLDEVKAIAQNIAENEAKINFHGRRADAIVKGMLQHSRSSSGMKEPTDVNAIADEYLRLAYHGLRAKDKTFNATMKTDFDPGVGKVHAVPQDIGRVVLNLITNAFYVVTEKKAQMNGKAAEGDTYEPTVTVSTKRMGSHVEIRVTDNGSGIPPAVLEKIFQPFFTTKPSGQGTGLGLSMSYDIITKGHGGELKVETHVGRGTTFIIALPDQ